MTNIYMFVLRDFTFVCLVRRKFEKKRFSGNKVVFFEFLSMCLVAYLKIRLY